MAKTVDARHRTLITLGEQPTGRGWRSLHELNTIDLAFDPDVFGLTDRGRVAETNQDQFVIAELNRALVVRHSSFPTPTGECFCDNPQGLVLGVAQGVERVGDGKLASAVALDALCAYALRLMPWVIEAGPDADETDVAAALEEAVVAAEERMQRVGARKDADPRLATMVTLAYVVWPRLFVVHIGDGSAFRLRGNALRRLTPDPRADGEGRNDTQSFLINALGGARPATNVDVHQTTLEPGDGLLLTTAGVTHHLDETQLARLIADAPDVQTAVQSVIDATNERGGEHNATAVLARF